MQYAIELKKRIERKKKVKRKKVCLGNGTFSRLVLPRKKFLFRYKINYLQRRLDKITLETEKKKIISNNTEA